MTLLAELAMSVVLRRAHNHGAANEDALPPTSRKTTQT